MGKLKLSAKDTVRMGALWGKLQSAFVLLFFTGVAQAEPAVIRAGDCGVAVEKTVLHESAAEASPAAVSFLRREAFQILEISKDWAQVAWLNSLNDCGFYEGGVYAGWTHKQNIKKIYPEKKGSRQVLLDLPANLRDAPDGKKIGSFQFNQGQVLIEEKGDWFYVSALTEGPHAAKSSGWKPVRGWIPLKDIQYVRLLSLKKIPDITISPSQLRVFGKSYTNEEICQGNMFTETGTFYSTSDLTYPFAVLCSGQLDGESAVLTLFSKVADRRSVPVQGSETSPAIPPRKLLEALDNALKPRH